MTKRQKKYVWQLLVVVMVLLFSALGAQKTKVYEQTSSQVGTYRVLEFDDGDTIVIDMNGSPEKVRFIGVDTPETKDPRKPVQCYGHEASKFTKNLISNSSVRLEADPTNTNRDRYSRLLRYVYTSDGTLVNAELIKQGYGFAYTGFPFQKKSEFITYQASAQKDGLGLWGNCQPSINEYGGYTSNDEPAT